MKYIDIGANLTSKRFDDKLDNIIKDSFNNDIDSIIITGTTLNGSKSAKNIVARYPQYKLYYTVGLHPHEAKNFNKKYVNEFKKLLIDPKAVAVGECGLDYNRNLSPKEKQIEAFEEQIKLAIEVNKPLFLHERDASDDFIKILSKYTNKIKAVVHCFTGNKETVKKYVEMGFYIGLTGWICDEKRNKNVIEAIPEIPLNKMMIETDAPFLNPLCPAHLNVPNNVKYVGKKLANVLGIEEKELSQILLNNTKSFFGI